MHSDVLFHVILTYLFFSQSLLVDPVPEDDTWDPSFDLLAGLFSSRSSLGRFLGRPGSPPGGDGELVNPRLRRRESSFDWASCLQSSSSLSNCWRSSLRFLIPALASISSSSLFSLSN